MHDVGMFTNTARESYTHTKQQVEGHSSTVQKDGRIRGTRVFSAAGSAAVHGHCQHCTQYMYKSTKKKEQKFKKRLNICRLWMRSSQVVRASDCQCQSPNNPEMAFTDMLLAKIYRFCQLSNHSHGFFC